MAKQIVSTPLDLGKEIQVAKASPTAAGSQTYQLSLDAEAVLVSLFVSATTGDVDVKVTTEGATGNDVEVISFPTVTAPTTDLLLRKSASVLRKIRITVTFTGTCTFEIRARGVTAGAASVAIEGAANFQVTQKDVTTTPMLLLPASLTDRNGIMIINHSNNRTIYIAETLAKATTSDGAPIYPMGGNMSIDLAAGGEIYAIADGGTADSRIVETGGS